MAGLIGLAALGRWLAKRRHPVDGVNAPAEATSGAATGETIPADPAEELRRKLANARGSEPEGTPASEPAETLDERRARVHSKAREAIDSMGDAGTPS